MACRTIISGPGVTAIACGPRGRRPPCSVPGCGRPHTVLCDFPVSRPAGKSQTCDAKLCDRCKVSVGPDLDRCPPHAGKAKPL